MKTNERQFFGRLGRGAFGLQVVVLTAMILLMGSNQPAWADDVYNDPGGGTYEFSYFYGGKGQIDFTNSNQFKTTKNFDYANDNYYWEWEFGCNAININDNPIKTTGGSFHLVTKSGTYTVATWDFVDSYYNGGATNFNVTNDVWGTPMFVDKTASSTTYGIRHEMTLRFVPSDRFFTEGIIGYYIKVEYQHKEGKSVGQGRFWYEKKIDPSICSESSPLPKLSLDWNDKGEIEYKASNFIKKDYSYKDYNVDNQAYYIRRIYTSLASNSYIANIVETCPTSDGVERADGNYDLTGSFWDLDYGTYTFPVIISYAANTDVAVWFTGYIKNKYNYSIQQPTIREVIKPFTSPVSVNVEFDQWRKKNKISWTARKKAEYWDNESDQKKEVNCRTDGKWYVVRYEKGKEPTDYTLVGSLNGNASKLELTDTEMEFEKEYVYRVIFLPSVLESGYSEKLTSLPSHAKDDTYYLLYKEKDTSTKLDAPIKLRQDRTCEQAVRLVWEYCMGLSGSNWTIEYNSDGSWRTLDNSMQVNPERSQASFDADGTVCDVIKYRVKTSFGGREFYSNVIEASLPAGSYISDVKASTGTEETSVKITWKVARADKNNSLTFAVKRRPVGTEEWTTLDNEIKGDKREFIDERPLAGTYYEYTVEAYGDNCPGQVTLTDAVITPGFSQARGTITGHISFGSGTAVVGARVNLVKASSDKETDQAQYLSRMISGEGSGLQWHVEREKYEKLFTGKEAFSTQMWVKPATDGEAQMSLLTLPGVIELGAKRIGDTSGYTLQLPDEDYMLIDNANDWETFVNAVNSGHTNLNAILTTDVDASAVKVMAGYNSENAYQGTFDGNGHILTVNYNTAEEYIAPFRCAAGATIKNLRVEGTLSSSAKFVGGIISSCASGTNTITNCRVSATIDSSVSGDATNGGFVAVNAGSSTLNISNCLFDGKFTGNDAHSVGGFVGWGSSKVNIHNSMVAPSDITTKSDASATFARMSNYNNLTLVNDYYTHTIGTVVQGTSTNGLDNSTVLAALGSDWKEISEMLLPVLKSEAWPTIPRKAYTVTTVDKRPGTSRDTTAVYQLYAVDLSTKTPKVTEFPGLTFSGQDFTHVAAVYDGASKWKFYMGSELLLADSMNVASNEWHTYVRTMSVCGNGRQSGSAYTGHVDDVRLWNRALKANDVEANYTRILGGKENGLILYWPLDEGENVVNYAFDIACQDNIYQLNHPEVGSNAVPSKDVPQHLKLYGLTDDKGNYIIKGVPFQQGGTNYELTPELGIHEFSPGTRTMFVSPTSLTANNIDFEDVSAFPMAGFVRYAGTNIPVEGAFLYVDGELQTKNGKSVQTDADGHYEMSVPIGKHYVTAEMDGHKMVAGGRFPQGDKLYDFDSAVTYDFADSTLVNFVGRVDGATRNDTLAVGFGKSDNLIGKALITLKLNNDSRLFNYYNDQAGSEVRAFESDTTAINSRTWAGAGSSDAKYIYIETDPQTGEFSALLPPLKYIVKSIEIPKNPAIEFITLPQIDLTSVRKELKDSLKVATETGDTITQYYTYNTKMVKTYFAEPQLVVTQKDSEGFGEQEMLKYAVSTAETTDIKNIWTKQADGTIKYNYGYPVFARSKEYKFDVHGFEVYTNYDSGTAVSDTVALNGQVVTVANEMSNIQDVVAKVTDPSLTNLKDGDIYGLKRTQLRLDKNGRNTITFTTGAPNVTAPYTRRFSMTFERNKRNYAGQSLDGIVLGELTNGDNFVTAGPDHVDMVLRDPPGAKGKVTWKTGTSYTKLHNDVKGAYLDESVTADLLWGTNISTAVGLGVAIISSTSAHQALTVGQSGSYTWQWKNDSTFIYTNAESISSSTGSKYVGAKGDVFIGKSHNFIVGTCRKLGFHREAGGIILGLKEAVSINDSIATDFIFSAREVEETMIPKLIETRNNLLQYMDEAAARSYVNNTEEDVYLTWKKLSDEDYGTEGTYVCKPGTKGRRQDMVLHYNQSVNNWKARLAENEKDKIEAMESRDKYLKENRSFDGGTSYTYSERRDSIYNSTYQTSTKVGVTTSFKTNLFVNYAASFGMNMDIKADAGYLGSSVVGDSLDNKQKYAEFEYELNDGNSGTDFSVDILRSPRGWSDIFVLRGGQSYNPYEGKQYAEYYEPEKKHVISHGTEQMEQPVIRISTDGEIGASSATLNDIPAGGTGQFTLHLTNGTTTNQTIPFTYELDVAETYNPKGLEILMDGVPANGRGIYIPAGETVKKTITVRQTDQSVLDYEGIVLWFCSSYQPFSIYDECKLNVHFVPSSSAIDLTIQEPVLNTDSKDGTLGLKLSNFNRQFKNLRNVGVQYRFAGNTQWTNLRTWWVSPADTAGVDNDLLPETGDIRYVVDMKSNLAFPEGNYEFRAFTTTPYGNEQVQVYSDIITVTKDMTKPRNLYTPAPADGILNYGDQLAIEFNEDIVPGYVGADNVIVTARLNQDKVAHDVALSLMPYGDTPRTVNPVFLNGDFSLEFWMKWEEGGTILHHGAKTDNFALAIGDDGYVTATIAKTQFRSRQSLPKNQWTFVALTYKSSEKTFNGKAVYGEENALLFSDEKVPNEALQAVTAVSDNYLYLGDVRADMHSLALYNIHRDMNLAIAEKDVVKDNYVYGLANYWPMDEGHGTVAADTRHTHDFTVDDSWVLKNKNYSLRIDDKNGAQADITRITTGQGDSYAIEMWYHNNGDKNEVVFETATPTVEGDLLAMESKVRVRLDSLKNLVLDYGKKSQIVASHTDFPNLMNWHHYALNVVRGQAASFYLDGQRTAVVAEADVPPIEGSRLVVGKNNTAIAFADELRIWHAALSERRLLSNMYNTLDTTDVYSRGLVAYYPFEKTGEENGVTTKVATLENMAPNLKAGDAKEVDYHANALFENTPPLKNAPIETRLIASPVASERKVVVNLTGAGISLRDIEGTTLNITVDQIHDLHGNTSEPIKWTAYVQQNTLKWMKDSVNVFKQYGDDYTFDVNIENRSGNEEYYTLYNMPQWLSLVDSERSDEVTPLSTKTLRFQVNPLVAVGNYDVTIGLQGNNAILEPLRLVMKVSGEKPQWAVDPTKYDHQMNIIGQVYINGILMENPESMVAAFIGGECRGVASPEKVRGAAYLTMTVYGIDNEQNDMGKAVTFRIWDASKGVAYTDAQLAVDGLPVNITFAQDKILGDFDTPAIWTKSENVEQLIPIHQNWNWIAFGVEPQSTDLDHVFGAYAEWNMLLKNRDYWNDYNGVQWGGGDLKSVKANEMYKLKVTSLPNSPLSTLHSPLSVSGRQLKEDSLRAVKLEKGWNWIAYTPLTTMTVDEALAGANPQKGDIVKSQTGVAIYGNYGWEGSLKALESGRGYLYNSSDDSEKTFVYPTETAASAAKAKTRMAAPRRAPEDLRIFKPVTLGLYPSNMTMAIQLRDGDAVVDTAEVAAFIGDECRGATRASENGLYYLVISGDGAGQSMVLRTCIDGEIIDIDNTQMYVSDANIGTSWEPYVIDLKNVLSGISSIVTDDNDDSDWWTLQGFKIGRKPTQPGVYIHHGQKITIKRKK